jgi:hypothetical protein
MPIDSHLPQADSFSVVPTLKHQMENSKLNFLTVSCTEVGKYKNWKGKLKNRHLKHGNDNQEVSYFVNVLEPIIQSCITV